MSPLYDVTLLVSPDLLTWPGDPLVSIRRTSDVAKGDSSTVSQLVLGSHAGTHVDAPVHFIAGADGIDRTPVESLVGDAFVADARGLSGPLDASHLDSLSIPDGVERLLIKSDNSDLWRSGTPEFPSSYVCLSPDGARWCVARGLRSVGVDFLSVEQKGAEGHPTHVTLLQAGIAIIEGLDLGAVDAGFYRLVCLPLRIQDADGAPARVLLIREDG